MEILQKLNSPFMYLLCGTIVLFVAAVCVVFARKAYRAGKEIGMDEAKMKQTVIASTTFAVLPGIGILLGVIALSGSLGTPWPWLRLSVIGALHYETQVAEAAAEAAGMSNLSAAEMTPKAFSTIALVMSACIMWGMVLCLASLKQYTRKLGDPDAGKKDTSRPSKFKGFGDIAMTAMFIGLVSTYIGSYAGTLVSSNGVLSMNGSWLPLAVAAAGALAMYGFILLSEKKKAAWIDSFSLAGSMLIAMAAAIFLAKL